MKNAAATLLMMVFSLVAACAPAAPTPTPVEVIATKPEDLAGIWFDGASYHRFEVDGTIKMVESIEDLDDPNYRLLGKFWFEDGIYHEQNAFCLGVYVYEIYLRIEEGRAVRIRMTVIEVPERPCSVLSLGTQRTLVRVD